jgi:hypothetical protein
MLYQMWDVIVLPEAEDELDLIPIREQAALLEAIAKLEAVGDRLGAPHSSNVEGTSRYLRELRPRRGSSPWRALYRRIGSEMVIGAFSPEAMKDRRGFNRAVDAAIERLDAYARGVGKGNE